MKLQCTSAICKDVEFNYIWIETVEQTLNMITQQWYLKDKWSKVIIQMGFLN